MIGVFKTILSHILPRSSQEAIGQGAQTFEKKKSKSKLADRLEAFSVEEARKKSQALLGKLKESGNPADLRLKMSIRKKVKKTIDSAFDDQEIVDEVTETIYRVAKQDKNLRERFR